MINELLTRVGDGSTNEIISGVLKPNGPDYYYRVIFEDYAEELEQKAADQNAIAEQKAADQNAIAEQEAQNQFNQSSSTNHSKPSNQSSSTNHSKPSNNTRNKKK